MNKKWVPITAGVLTIISGLWTTVFHVGASLFLSAMFITQYYAPYLLTMSLIRIALFVLIVIGGVQAFKRKNWPLALAGAVAALICSMPILMDYHDPFSTEAPESAILCLWAFIIVPAVAVILTALSRKQFAKQRVEGGWKPITAGALNLIGGTFATCGGIIMSLMDHWWHGSIRTIMVSLLFIGGALAIVSGIYALKRKKWPLVLAGSFTALICPLPVLVVYWLNELLDRAPEYSAQALYPLGIVGIPIIFIATILILLSGKEFKGKQVAG